jgi:hypothetical protein
MPERITSYEKHVNYFKAIAAGLKALNPGNSKPNFYEFQDFFGGSNLKYPAMVMVPPVNSLTDPKSDNIFKEFACDIWIMHQVKKDDIADKNIKLTLCEKITEQVIAKIKKDYEDYTLGSNRPFNEIDWDRLKYTQLGPQQNDNLYGYSLEFTYGNPIHLTIDTNLWW